MSENVTIQMNLSSGEILIQAPADTLDAIFDKLESFLPGMVAMKAKFENKAPERPEVPQNDKEDTILRESSPLDVVNTVIPKRKRSTSSKKAESYKIAQLGLNEQQRQAFREFYYSKNPKSQNEQIMVIMYWLKNNGGKDSLSKDDIYTGYKTVDAKVPARISSVLSNLSIEGKIISESDGYHLHHTGEDFVKFDLPKKDGNS